MRGLIIIVATTLIVILVGTATIHYLEQTASELAKLLFATLDAIAQEDWGQAQEMFNTSLTRWEEIQGIWGALINHKEVDEIRMALERAKEYVVNRDKTSALAELAVAKLLVEHVPEKERLSWANIF